MTAAQYANRYFKGVNFKADTEDNRLFINEAIYSSNIVLRDQLLFDSNLIPTTEPYLGQIRALTDGDIWYDPVNTWPVIQCFVKRELPRYQNTNAFYDAILEYCIPRNYADNYTYIYRLYYEDGGIYYEIPFLSGLWTVDLRAGIVRFYCDSTVMDTYTHGATKLYITFYKYVGRIGTSAPLLEAASTDDHASGTYWPDVGLGVGQTMTTAFTLLNDRIYSLLPTRPTQLAATTLPMTVYSARKAGSDNAGGGLITNMFYGNTVTLTATVEFQVYIDDVLHPVIVDAGGTHDGLELTVIKSTTPSCADWNMSTFNSYHTDLFYTITAIITPTLYTFTASTSAEYSIRLANATRSTTSLTRSFYHQPVFAPIITASKQTGVVGALTRVSGIYCFPSGYILNVRITGVVTDYFYNATNVAKATTAVDSTYPAPLTNSIISLPNTENCLPPVGSTGQGASAANVTTITIPDACFVCRNTYNCVTIGPSGAESGTLPLLDVGTGATAHYRVDTVSTSANEASVRVHSGRGQYPIYGAGGGADFGGVFNSTESLLAPNEELQMIKRYFTFPYQVDYRVFELDGATVNVDYSAITGGTYNNMRWVTFAYIGGSRAIIGGTGNKMTNAIGLDIVFTDAYNFGTDKIVTDFCLYIIVLEDDHSRVINWVDGNAEYSGFGTPGAIADGDAVLDLGKTASATSKHITFGGQVLTGNVYIRIGLASGSNKIFYDITVTQTPVD